MKKVTYLFVLLLVVILAACGSGNEGYRNVDAKQAKQLIDDNKVTVIDVRTQEEFQEGHIPNAILIPVQELEGKLKELQKEEPYLIVCRSGNRSAQASEILGNNGFKKIYNMMGGMNTWEYETAN